MKQSGRVYHSHGATKNKGIVAKLGLILGNYRELLTRISSTVRRGCSFYRCELNDKHTVMAGLTFLSLSLAACSTGSTSGYFSGQKDAYLRAKSVAPIQVPAGLNANGFRSTNPIPNRHYSEQEKVIELGPPSFNS